ncbi:DeoR/GlpR family DNA-binding transcription regulator [Tropicimonas sp. IMCC34043]|uniref:DeoR/GlpR family DNA-binding transcription regulator n=1 Tax=Tropicimonas sp. IMCC34043 TaxID=2248760 RepID=UPI000E22F6E8|nr:DeoR/GlpR family DNA-binding transcription regulator [Tropicimonas sp. IMCC34043]
MRPIDRRAEIAALVERRGEQSVETLAQAFAVSAETIRRDLARLATDGVLRKVHGGARPLARLHVEPSFQDRMAEDPEAKAAIAAKLVPEIGAGDTIMIDTGSTTLIAAEAMAGIRGLSVITNSLAIASSFGRRAAEDETQVFLLGGSYAAGNHQTVGAAALAQLDLYRADHAIVTVAALAPDIGAMDSNVAEAEIARAMIARAQNVIVLATASKFGRRAAFRVCGFDEIDVLVTERPPEASLADALGEAGVTIR